MNKEECEPCKFRRIGTLATAYGPADIMWGHYPNGGSPLVLLQKQDGEILTVLSVNLPEKNGLLAANEFFAKTWGENEEFAPLVRASGFVKHVKTSVVVAESFVAPVWLLVGSRVKRPKCRHKASTFRFTP